MSMLEIKNVHKSFFTYTKPRLQAGIFHRPGARKVTSELQVLRGVDLTVEKGDVGHPRPLRLRQDHPAALSELSGDCRRRPAHL